jgi:hypothetical protein
MNLGLLYYVRDTCACDEQQSQSVRYVCRCRQRDGNGGCAEVGMAGGDARPPGLGAVEWEMQSMQMVGKGSIFERGAHVPVTHMAFFKPPATAFLSELKPKDRRPAKEWEYIIAAGVWLELGQAAMALARRGEDDMTPAVMARMLALADKAFRAAREVLVIRGQYFDDIVQYGMEAARQTAFLVEQNHNAVHSLSHSTARESLNQRLERDAAKMPAKAYLGRAGGGGGAGSGNPGSGSSADGAAADACGLSWKEVGRVGWLGDSTTGDGRPFGRRGGGTWGRQDTKFMLCASVSCTPHQSLSHQVLSCLLSPKARRIWNLEGKTSARVVRRVSTRRSAQRRWGRSCKLVGWCRRPLLCGRGRGGAEGALCDQFCAPEPALGERVGQD